MKTNTILEKTTAIKMLILSLAIIFPAFVAAGEDDKTTSVTGTEISAVMDKLKDNLVAAENSLMYKAPSNETISFTTEMTTVYDRLNNFAAEIEQGLSYKAPVNEKTIMNKEMNDIIDRLEAFASEIERDIAYTAPVMNNLEF